MTPPVGAGGRHDEVMRLLMDLPTTLDETRQARGLTYRALAGQLQIPVSTLHDLVTGKQDLKLPLVLTILSWIGEGA